MAIDYRALAQDALARREALVNEMRSLKPSETTRAEALNADILALEDEARGYVEQGEREAEVRKAGAGSPLAFPGGSAKAEVRHGQPIPEGRGFADLPGVSVASNYEFGEYVRSMVYGGEVRAAEGTNAAGGFLVPVQYAAGVLDLARNKTQVVNAGALVVPMASKTQQMAKVESDPAAGWRNEAAAIAASDITFGAVTLTARSLAVNVKASWELVEDASNFGEVLANSLSSAFAVKLDAAALYGSGVAPEPLGLKNAAGVTITPVAANGGALTNWDKIVTATQAVRTANYDPTAMVMAERTSATLSTFKDTAGQYVPAPQYLDGIKRLASGNVPTNLAVGTSGNVTSDLFVGDFKNLIVGLRTSFEIKVLKERYADTGEVGFIGWLRADVQVARADAFQIISGITA